MNSTNYLTYLAFFGVCFLILTLPFIPAFREWMWPTDVAPLPVSANYSADIDHFARRLRGDAMARLGQGPATGHEDFQMVGEQMTAKEWSEASRRLMTTRSINTPEAVRTTQPVYVDGDFVAGGDSSVLALYATGDIALGATSRITDWAHADGVLRVGQGGMALRRISAGQSIELDIDAWFERLSAPLLRFGQRASRVLPPTAIEQTPGSYADLPGAVAQTPTLYLIRGDCILPAAQVFRGSLVVTGFLTVGAATTVHGDIKARDGVSLGHRAAVLGAITCEKRIYLFPDARAWGPVISESDVLIGASAVVGLPDAPTTVSGLNVIVEDGVLVHGAIWAHEIGMVKPA